MLNLLDLNLSGLFFCLLRIHTSSHLPDKIVIHSLYKQLNLQVISCFLFFFSSHYIAWSIATMPTSSSAHVGIYFCAILFLTKQNIVEKYLKHQIRTIKLEFSYLNSRVIYACACLCVARAKPHPVLISTSSHQKNKNKNDVTASAKQILMKASAMCSLLASVTQTCCIWWEV